MIEVYNKIPEEFKRDMEESLKKESRLQTPVVFETGPEGERAYDVFSRLMLDRIIYFDHVVTTEAASVVKAQLLFLDAQSHDDITMYIDSPGGSIYAGLGLYDTMQYIKSNISTVCVGLAASMGSVLLAAGTKGKRYALPHSTILIHQPLGEAEGQADDIRIRAQEITRLEEILMDIYVKHTGQSKEKLKADTRRDHIMTPKEALEYGIIDAVISSKKEVEKEA